MTAIEITGADFGNVQLFDPDSDTLGIAVSRGLEKPFLEHFAKVSIDDPTVCSAAMRRGERVVIDDITTSNVYAGSDALDVLAKAGLRAMQSTPLITRSGRFIGIFCTHYRAHRIFSDRDSACWTCSRAKPPTRSSGTRARRRAESRNREPPLDLASKTR